MALGIPGSDPSDSAGAIFALFSYVSDTLGIYSEPVRQVAENDMPSFHFGDSGIGPTGAILLCFPVFLRRCRSRKTLI